MSLTLVLVAGCGEGSEPRRPTALATARTLTELHEALLTRRGPAYTATFTELSAMGARAVPTLLTWLGDPERAVREAAAHALGDLRPTTDEAIDALIASIEDEDDWVRWKAIRALGKIGPPARRALPALRAIVDAARITEIADKTAADAIHQIEGITQELPR